MVIKQLRLASINLQGGVVVISLSIVRALKLLHVVELLVIAVLGKEIVVRTTLNDAAFMEYANFVCVLDGREAVSNGNRCAGLHQAFEGFLHEAFAFGVECRSRFVENENVGILQDGASN